MGIPNPTAPPTSSVSHANNPNYPFYKHLASWAVTALVINGLVHLFLKTSFMTSLAMIVALVFIEEHVLINLYIAFKNRHEIVKSWTLSQGEKLVFIIAVNIFNFFLHSSIIDVFPFSLLYRTLPFSWEIGINLATVNIFFDILLLY